jgi:hypothetical protein
MNERRYRFLILLYLGLLVMQYVSFNVVTVGWLRDLQEQVDLLKN